MHSVVREQVDVTASQSRAFEIFTAEISQWWPRSHTPGNSPVAVVTMDAKVGGKIYTIGSNPPVVLGMIIGFDPPTSLQIDWYLGTGIEQPTAVEVKFLPLANDRGTRVIVEHTAGRNPDAWPNLMTKFIGGWRASLANFQLQLVV